MKGTNAVEHAK
jgi:hypothetical protein